MNTILLQFDVCTILKKVTSLKQERFHCIRYWFRLIFKKWFLKCRIYDLLTGLLGPY